MFVVIVATKSPFLNQYVPWPSCVSMSLAAYTLNSAERFAVSYTKSFIFSVVSILLSSFVILCTVISDSFFVVSSVALFVVDSFIVDSSSLEASVVSLSTLVKNLPVF